MPLSLRRLALLLTTLTTLAPASLHAQIPWQSLAQGDPDRAHRHQSTDWLIVAPHLPDPATATAAQLQMAGDILRARRLPEDAIEFYGYALRRGGADEAVLLNRIGITELGMQHITAANIYFKRVVKLHGKLAEGWNNLGATEYLGRNVGRAVSDYKRAVKLSASTAVYHSNLGTALFEQKNFAAAQQQYETAIQLDPDIFRHDSANGVMAHVLSPDDRGRFCFEMARLSFHHNDTDEMLRWLAKATESGFDIQTALNSDPEMSALRKDPQIAVLIHNASALGARELASTRQPAAPPLPAQTTTTH